MVSTLCQGNMMCSERERERDDDGGDDDDEDDDHDRNDDDDRCQSVKHANNQ